MKEKIIEILEECLEWKILNDHLRKQIETHLASEIEAICYPKEFVESLLIQIYWKGDNGIYLEDGSFKIIGSLNDIYSKWKENIKDK